MEAVLRFATTHPIVAAIIAAILTSFAIMVWFVRKEQREFDEHSSVEDDCFF